MQFFLWIDWAEFISYDFHLKGDNKNRTSKFKLSYFTSNFNAAFLQNDHLLYWLLMDHKKSFAILFLKRSKISHIWKAYLTLELVKQDKCLEKNGFIIFLCPICYYVLQFTVWSKVQCPQLLLIFLLSLVFMLRSHHGSLCVADYFSLFSIQFITCKTFSTYYLTCISILLLSIFLAIQT